MNWLWLPAFARHHVVEKFFPGQASRLYSEIKGHYEMAFYHYSRGELAEGDGFEGKFVDARDKLKDKLKAQAQFSLTARDEAQRRVTHSLLLGSVDVKRVEAWVAAAESAKQDLSEARNIGLRLMNERDPREIDRLKGELVKIDRSGRESEESW